MNAPYPHVQHIHGGAKGVCLPASADKDGDGVVSTTEGAPSCGAIVTTLSTSGDTSRAAGPDLKLAGQGASYTVDRMFELSSETKAALEAGTAVVVVHGLDPATLSPAGCADTGVTTDSGRRGGLLASAAVGVLLLLPLAGCGTGTPDAGSAPSAPASPPASAAPATTPAAAPAPPAAALRRPPSTLYRRYCHLRTSNT
ncbi:MULTISPECIES: hypothetical protein [unclassified Arthrobacter]|uniref:hypothetical protein n=1 Tax=Pseudarthrobacter sp. S6 TaxID=3418420 RepID=UPI00339A97F7